MTVYQPPDIEVDRAAIAQGMIDDLQSAIPGLTVAPGTLLWALVQTWAARHGEQLELLVERAEGEFDAYGRKLVRVPRRDATAATTSLTVENTAAVNKTLPAGSQFSLADVSGGRHAFASTVDGTITAGGTGTVDIVAVVPGAEATGLSLDPQPEITLSWIGTVTVDATTTGGEDAEDIDAYVNRLADDLTLLAKTLTTPAKFATFARNQPNVGRALAIDLYNAATSTAGVAGHITVALVADNGGTVGTLVKNAVLAELEANRITNLAVHVIDPTYTALTVVFTAVAYAGFDPADVEARAEAAVLAFLSPATWGSPPFGDQVNWIDTPIVRFQDVSTVLNQVEGLDHWTALTINGGTADVTLTGPAALPSSASTASGTVT